MNFFKYHALGNDYIVLEPGEVAGGVIDIVVSDDFLITMTEPVTEVTNGVIAKEMFD